MPSREDSSNRIGEHLLKGWKMLGDSCPSCYSPLMQPRGSDSKLCVVCTGRSSGNSNSSGQTSKSASSISGSASRPGTIADSASSPAEKYAEMWEAEMKKAAGASVAGAGAVASPAALAGIASSAPVQLTGSRILPAPPGWQSMSPEELRAAVQAQAQAGRSQASTATVPAAAPARPAVAPQPRAAGLASSSSTASSGTHVRLLEAQGNVGPRGDGSVVMLPTVLAVPEPDPDMVARIAAGLGKAAEEDGKPEARGYQAHVSTFLQEQQAVQQAEEDMVARLVQARHARASGAQASVAVEDSTEEEQLMEQYRQAKAGRGTGSAAPVAGDLRSQRLGEQGKRDAQQAAAAGQPAGAGSALVPGLPQAALDKARTGLVQAIGAEVGAIGDMTASSGRAGAVTPYAESVAAAADRLARLVRGLEALAKLQ